MDRQILEYVTAKTHELMQAPTCSSETKAAAQAWLSAVGTAAEKEQTGKYVEDLEADIMPIDQLIGFAGSEAGIQYFGEAAAKGIVSHAEEIKANGARYCDCPACAAAEAILKKLEIL